ncbi:DNA repair protein RadC [Candidatus Pacearchaeota archaeon]|nr:DNA repair protein RadC [Candidatus Pacearchaeota archaeon]
MTKYAYRLETRRIKENDFPYDNKEGFSSPDKVKDFLKVLDDFDNEQFVTLLLNSKNQLVGMLRQPGTVNQTAAYPREIAKHALLSGATSVILAHNHPSGNVTPSRQDRELTRLIKNGLELLQINVLDHMIIGSDEKVYSFANEGEL